MRYPLNNFIYENYKKKYFFEKKYVINKIKEFIDNPDEKFVFYDYKESYENSGFFGDCQFIIKIIDECPYKGGKFLFSFHFPKETRKIKNSIFTPPKIELINKIYHPNFKGEQNCILYDCNEGNPLAPKKPHYHPRKLKELKEDLFLINNINSSLNLIYSLIINPSL